jgi:type I restriction enzyme R subunit
LSATGNRTHLEYSFIGDLQRLKYTCRSDVRGKAALERNFYEKYETLNRVRFSNAEFSLLCDEVANSDVFVATETLCARLFHLGTQHTFEIPLVQTKGWCKNECEAID